MTSTLLSMGLALAHFVLPLVLSTLGVRYDWSPGPSWWNVLGLVGIFVGSALMASAMNEHFRRLGSLDTVRLNPPDYLITSGSYSFTRNPIYIGALLIWLGWSVFLGSPLIVAGFLLFAVASFYGVPREEKKLAQKFGEPYLRYKEAVPRWLGRRRQLDQRQL